MHEVEGQKYSKTLPSIWNEILEEGAKSLIAELSYMSVLFQSSPLEAEGY